MQRFLALLIAGQITLLLIMVAYAADPFTSAGVDNPNAPVGSGINTNIANPNQPGAGNPSGTNTGQTSGSAAGTGAGTNTGISAPSGVSPQACLGTDLLLSHGFTQSELTRLEQDQKLSYPDRIEYKDSDGDGLFDNEELLLKTDPNKADTDGDGYSDTVEIAFGFDPLQKNKVRTFGESLPNNTLWANQILQSLRYALDKLPNLAK